jgi:xanthine dehydrogenase YagR molybdenum-binding subunit
MATEDKKVKLLLGFGETREEVEITIPDEEPLPWDLTTKFSVVGGKHGRSDALAKVTGAAKYTHDINLPGMLFGGFARSPHAAAEVVAIDTSAAEKVDGVKAVIPMQQERVRYAGQPVAAIAATTRQALAAAIAAIKVEWKTLPHAARIEDAMREGAPVVHKNQQSNVTGSGRARNDERVSAEMSSAHKVVKAVARTQVQTHSCLETHGTVAQWKGDDLTIWTSTQATFGVRSQVADALRIDESRVTVLCEFMGGGFGSKFGAGYYTAIAARLAQMAGAPVKIMFDRREEHTDTGNRPDSIQDMELGVGADGKLGPYSVKLTGTPGIGRGAGAANPMIYHFPRELRAVTQTEVATNAGQQAAMRAPGHPQGSFGLECILDLAAEALGMDPLEFRMKNDSNPVRLAQYKEGAQKIGWQNRRKNGSATGRFRRGLGVAASTWGGLGGPSAEVDCKIFKDGSVQVRNGSQDIGTGTKTVMAVVAAEELGLPLEKVRPFMGDTNDPVGPASGGSTTAPSIAPAARQAAYLAGRELKALVAKHLGVAAEKLLMRQGRISTAEGKGLSFEDACRLITSGEIRARGKRRSNFRTFRGGVAGCQFAEVEVDCDYGLVRVVRVVALQDAGIILNRLQAESQVNGGVIQGLAYALHEERIMDRQLGHQVNANLEFYKLPGMKDMPEIECVLYDVANGGNNTSVCGLGEPTCVPTASAIAGAIHNALGVRIYSLPMTPDKVLAALATKGAGK